MMSDLFGNAVVDPMPSRQSLLFHVPVDVAPAPLSGSTAAAVAVPSWRNWRPRPKTAADYRIERQYDSGETPVLPESDPE